MVLYRLWAERLEDGDGKWFPKDFYDMDSALAFAGKNTSGFVRGKYIIDVYRNNGKNVRLVGQVFRINRRLIFREIKRKDFKRDIIYSLGTNGKIKEPIGEISMENAMEIWNKV